MQWWKGQVIKELQKSPDDEGKIPWAEEELS